MSGTCAFERHHIIFGVLKIDAHGAVFNALPLFRFINTYPRVGHSATGRLLQAAVHTGSEIHVGSHIAARAFTEGRFQTFHWEENEMK